MTGPAVGWVRAGVSWAVILFALFWFFVYEWTMWLGWIAFALWGMRIDAGPPGTH